MLLDAHLRVAPVEADLGGSLPFSVPGQEVVVLAGERTVLQIEKVIERRKFGSVVSVVDRPELAIKYAANCASLDAMHPLVRDFVVRSHVEELEVTNDVLFLSPEAKLDVSMVGNFSASPAELSACAADPRSVVHFLVVERDRATISAMVKDHVDHRMMRVPFADALKVIGHGIEALGALHEAKGVAHGNVHPATVVLLDNSKTGFSNFENAWLVTDSVVEGAHPPSRAMRDCFASPSDGSAQGVLRDDVVRLLMVGAYMIHGRHWMAHCKRLARQPAAVVAYKETKNFFQLIGRPDPLSGLEAELKDEVLYNLANAIELARSASGIDYGQIQQALRNARTLFVG